ncbi:hypothetical protein C0993_001973 [Termitomyces sp. T159_Od127]|nr:hypothetical protein C0993_001973 [Termitomyces sp. T159_Od127]
MTATKKIIPPITPPMIGPDDLPVVPDDNVPELGERLVALFLKVLAVNVKIISTVWSVETGHALEGDKGLLRVVEGRLEEVVKGRVEVVEEVVKGRISVVKEVVER